MSSPRSHSAIRAAVSDASGMKAFLVGGGIASLSAATGLPAVYHSAYNPRVLYRASMALHDLPTQAVAEDAVEA